MKTMLITGASRGIGAATALLAAENDFAVVIHYHKNKPAAEKVTDHIVSKGGTAVMVQADISKEQDIVRLFCRGRQAFGEPECIGQQCRYPRTPNAVRRDGCVSAEPHFYREHHRSVDLCKRSHQKNVF